MESNRVGGTVATSVTFIRCSSTMKRKHLEHVWETESNMYSLSSCLVQPLLNPLLLLGGNGFL